MIIKIFLATAMFVTAAISLKASEIELRYSSMYDNTYKGLVHRYPSAEAIAEQCAHAKKLWAEQEVYILQRIRDVADVDVFPTGNLVIYLVGYGRGISDPLTVSLFAYPNDDGFKPQSDEEFLRNLTHELLHLVVQLPKYDDTWYDMWQAYPDEPRIVINHILVIGLETRLYGYDDVASWYGSAQKEYRRALALAKELKLTSEKPVPQKSWPASQMEKPRKNRGFLFQSFRSL